MSPKIRTRCLSGQLISCVEVQVASTVLNTENVQETCSIKGDNHVRKIKGDIDYHPSAQSEVPLEIALTPSSSKELEE